MLKPSAPLQPELRRVARSARQLPLEQILTLLASPWHEHRTLALLLMVDQHRTGSAERRDSLHRAYLESIDRVDNWDLVDLSAPELIGSHIPADGGALVVALATSDRLWERRIAIVSTLQCIRAGDFEPTLRIAGLLVNDGADLIHKATGWMLREVYKRDGRAAEAFLDTHYRAMPRTMLRYAIERMPPERREHYMART